MGKIPQLAPCSWQNTPETIRKFLRQLKQECYSCSFNFQSTDRLWKWNSLKKPISRIGENTAKHEHVLWQMQPPSTHFLNYCLFSTPALQGKGNAHKYFLANSFLTASSPYAEAEIVCLENNVSMCWLLSYNTLQHFNYFYKENNANCCYHQVNSKSWSSDISKGPT